MFLDLVFRCTAITVHPGPTILHMPQLETSLSDLGYEKKEAVKGHIEFLS